MPGLAYKSEEIDWTLFKSLRCRNDNVGLSAMMFHNPPMVDAIMMSTPIILEAWKANKEIRGKQSVIEYVIHALKLHLTTELTILNRD